MTFALIMLIVFSVARLGESVKIKADKLSHRKQTITNVKLQDELSIKNFKQIIDDLKELTSATNLSGDSLIDAIESLYQKYDIPDERTEERKIQDRKEYLLALNRLRQQKHYPKDDSRLPLVDKIWYYPWKAPHLDRLDLMFGTPNTTIVVDGVKYKYDHRGIPSNMYWTIPAQLIGKIKVLLTIRDLDAEGFNYSWNRRESYWQLSERNIKRYTENQKKYPWLYK